MPGQTHGDDGPAVHHIWTTCRLLADFVEKVENLAAQNFREIPIMPKIAAARPVGVAYSAAQGNVGNLAGGDSQKFEPLAYEARIS